MAKTISQEYFNSIVSENINDFEMSPEDAVKDAIEQLQSQGVTLTTIAKFPIEEQNIVTDSIKALDEIAKNSELTVEDADKCKKLLSKLKEKFDKDISFKCLASRSANAITTFENFMQKFQKNKEVMRVFWSAFKSYLHHQSDIITESGLKALIALVRGYENDSEILPLVLKCINSSCQMCEKNRQRYVENGLCEVLLNLIQSHKNSEAVIVETCHTIRGLLLDDDMRVEFGRAHEHAKFIASQLNGIHILLQVGLSNDVLHEETLGNIMLTLSKLAVRNEYCQEICDKGGLKFVIKCIAEEHLQNLGLLKSALTLLKSICNNDEVKNETTKSNGVFLLTQVLSKYNANHIICELGCASLATILLRNIEACQQLFDIGGDLVLLQILNTHTQKPRVAKYCCMAIRNLVSRNKAFGEKVLANNVEDPLRKVLSLNDQTCCEEAKAALRDLDLHIELKELWTGSGKQLAD